MPYTTKDYPDQIKGLPSHGRRIWVSAYNSAFKNYKPENDQQYDKKKSKSKNKEAYAARVAWGAVKKKYKKSGDKWVAKALLLPLVVARCIIKNGQRRFMFTGSSDSKDLLGERLDPSIFGDFIYNFERGYPGPIHVDIAHYSYHYPAIRNLVYTGEVDQLYQDGRYIKGWAHEYDDNPLSDASWEMLKRSMRGELDYLISCSLGFMPDFGNVGYHDDVFTYRGGRNKAYIDHLAKTAFPANPDAEIIIEEVAMATKSKGPTPRDDAERVVGDVDLVEEIEEARKKAGVPKAGTGEGLVIKAEDEDEEEPIDDEELDEDEEDLEEEESEEEEPEDLTPEVEEPEAEEEPAPEEEEPEVRAATDAEKKAQKGRRKQYGIQILSKGTNITVPKKYADMGASFADFADPVNCKYPVWLTKSKGSLSEAQLKQVRNAPARWAQHKDAYTPKSRKKVEARITKALKKFEVGEFAEKATTKAEMVDIAPSPYGGATSIQEAQDYIEAAEAEGKAWDNWYMFRSVAENILRDPGVEDKSAAIARAIDEFRDLLVAKSLLQLDEGPETEPEKQPEAKAATEPPATEEAGETPTQEAAPTEEVKAKTEEVKQLTPEQRGIRVAKSWGDAVEAVLLSNAPMQAKRAALGESLVQVASALEGTLQETPPPSQAQAIDLQVIIRAIEDGFAGVMAQMTKQTKEVAPAEGGEKPPPPTRKSAVPLVQASAITTRAQNFGEIVDRLIGG